MSVDVMKAFVSPVVAVGLIALGSAGTWFGATGLEPWALGFFVYGAAMLALGALRLTYDRSGSPRPADRSRPRPLRLRWRDYPKAFVCWLNAFKRTYVVEPGLYYFGAEYDRSAPLLVTSNYFLTVWLVARHARRRGARLLVVDTDGINVWCSAGKGAFSAGAVLEQLERYDRELLTDGERITLILPKLAFAGVSLRALREEGIRPIIGPLYAKDLGAYLDSPPYRDRVADRVRFGLKMRAFSWLPGLLQLLAYGGLLALLHILVARPLDATGTLSVLGLIAFLATAYPLLFPWLPGRRFAVKGLWLAAFTSAGLYAVAAIGRLSAAQTTAMALFVFAMALFIALSYTGNSAVSNYSRVRKEIARFLPLNALFAVAAIVVFFVAGGRP